MSKRDRRDSDGRDRDRRDGDRRDYQPEDEGQRRTGEGDMQEGDSVTALKAILSKVAALLKPLNLSAEESIRLVEQLYGSVLDMDVALAGEADDTRKSSTLAYIHNTAIRREGERLVVQFPSPDELREAQAAPPRGEAGAQGEARVEVGAQAPAAGAPARGEAPVRSGSSQPRSGRPRPAGPRPQRVEQAPGPDAGAPPQSPPLRPEERGPGEREEPEGPEA